MPRLARLFFATALCSVLAGGVVVNTAFGDVGSPAASVVAGCVPASGTAYASVSYYSPDDEATGDVAWVATGTAGVVDHGTVTLTNGHAQFNVEHLVRGDYHVSFTPAGDEMPSVTDRFIVIGCVTTEVSCKAVTFHNPVGNPVVEIEWSPPFDTDSPDEDGLYAQVAPGQQVTRRTALPAIGWLGIVSVNDHGTYRTAYPGSDWNLPVPHDCSRPLTTLVRRCVKRHPRIELTFAREGSDQMVRFSVKGRGGKYFTRAELKSQQTTAKVKLPGPGRYTYRSYFDSAVGYESIAFRIKTCGGHR